MFKIQATAPVKHRGSTPFYEPRLVQDSIELLRSRIDGVEETTDARGLREGQKTSPLAFEDSKKA